MRRKGWFTVLLAAVMALAMTSVIASAAEWGDDYNTAETLYIATTEDFLTFVEMSQSGATFEGKTVILRNSLDLDGVSIGPIGVDNYMTYSFMGTFDGQGNSITGLSISLPPYSTTNCALFGKIENGTVRGLTLENAEIPSDTFGYTAGIAGELDNGTVENCHVINSNITVSTSMYAGGIVGLNNGGTITGCTVMPDCSVTGTENVGAIIGDNASGFSGDGAKPGIINTNIWPEALGNSPAAAGTGSEGNDGEGVTNNSAYGEDGQLNEPVTVGEEGG